MAEIRESQLPPQVVRFPFYFTITDPNGATRSTRYVVDPCNRPALEAALNKALDQYEALDCATVLSPESLWRQPLASWGKYFAGHAIHIPRVFGTIQGWLLLTSSVSGGGLAVGAIAYYASPLVSASWQQSLDKLMTYLASGLAVIVGLTALSFGAEWGARLPLLKYQRCKGLKDQITELYDVKNAIAQGQTPEKKAAPIFGRRVPTIAHAHPNRFVMLPNDIDLGTAATVDAALSQRGTGAVDRLMSGLSIFIGMGAGSAAVSAGATLTRGAAATVVRAATTPHTATAFRTAAGAL